MTSILWQLKHVPEATRRIVKAFAAKNGISLAEALKRLVEAGEKALDGKLMEDK